MINMRFNLPEETAEELDQYVIETMPQGYATSVSNLIKYGLYHQMTSDTFEIFIGMPWRILETDQETEEDEIRRQLAEVFAGHKGMSLILLYRLFIHRSMVPAQSLSGRC